MPLAMRDLAHACIGLLKMRWWCLLAATLLLAAWTHGTPIAHLLTDQSGVLITDASGNVLTP
jgi:hypothetical protein